MSLSEFCIKSAKSATRPAVSIPLLRIRAVAQKHFFLRRAPAHFWASEFSTIPTARGDGVFGQGRVFGHMSGNATNSLLKNCFGSPFRAAKRRGTSLFVGFWRAVIPYCAHSSTFEILFQQAANQELAQHP